MQIQISHNILQIEIDTDAGVIQKQVIPINVHRSGSGEKICSQGRIYIHQKYIGRQSLILLTESKVDSDRERFLDFDGKKRGYYDVLLRDIKCVMSSKEYATGAINLPGDWAGKTVSVIVLSA